MAVVDERYKFARKRMVEEQLVPRGIHDPNVLRSMGAVPRERFVLPAMEHAAYCDGALSIGRGVTISQPYIVAVMTQSLALSGNEKVLEIGTGSGYQAAVLAEITQHVLSVERDAVLYHGAKETLRSLGYHSVVLRWGDGMQGWPQMAPFDRIIVTAAADAVPAALLEQLRVGGILVMPVGPRAVQTLTVIEKTETSTKSTEAGGVVFVPLTEGTKE
jgi:protein-L-isoaspartate(D-aspartate) O-methyltransferase